MPRRDRRFTGNDVRRFYCKNLTAVQRSVFDLTDCDWSDYDTEEQARKILEYLANSDAVGALLEALPYGNYIRLALDGITELLSGETAKTAFKPLLTDQTLYPVPQLPSN